VHFLQLWANAKNLNVRFDVINAGRPGLDSRGISKIMQFEVEPLNPDLVVYDPGANDFNMAGYVKSSVTPIAPLTGSDEPLPLQNHSALLDRIYQLIFRPTSEPTKPPHTLTFDFSPHEPALTQSKLPFRLNEQIADADAISNDVRNISGRLFVTSFIALPYPGLRLDPERDRTIIAFLNSKYWPLTYAELREGFDFQNNVYRELAGVDNYEFLDVSRYFPRDPSLFSDAFHFRTQSGERLEGWIMGQLLAPYIKDAIDRGKLPKPVYTPDKKSIAWATASPIKFNLSCLPR
jgi:hypothetical protein